MHEDDAIRLAAPEAEARARAEGIEEMDSLLQATLHALVHRGALGRDPELLDQIGIAVEHM